MASSFPYLGIAQRHSVPYGLVLALAEWYDNPRGIALDDPRWHGWLTGGWGMQAWACETEDAHRAERERRWDNDWVFQFTDDRGRIISIWECGKITGADVGIVINRIPQIAAKARVDGR